MPTARHNLPRPDADRAEDAASPDAPSHTEPRVGWQGALVGTVVNDRYRVLEQVASGGMGVVYKAEQTALGRVVALKVLNTSAQAQGAEGAGADAQRFRARFLREAAAAARLVHPHTVVVFDYGAHGPELLYIAMEFLEGRTLHRAIIDEGAFAPARALHVALQTCAALRDAHAAGMVHRDIKPANVMLTTRGTDADYVKVMDFGLVKVQTDALVDQDLTREGLIMGSPRYMSPEQITGARVDHRSDIYSFGVVLFHMLAGRPPFVHATSFATLQAHVNEAPPVLRAVNPRCTASARLEALVARCMAKLPDSRPQSMAAVIAELQGCVDELGLATAWGPIPPSTLPTHTLPLPAAGAGDVAGDAYDRLPTTPLATSGSRPSSDPTRLGLPSMLAASAPREPAPQPPADRRPLIAAGALAFALLVGVGTYLAFRRSEPGARREVVAQSAAATSGAQPASVAPAAAPASAAASSAAMQPVRLTTTPPGAHVTHAGRDLGDTPTTLRIPRGEEWTVELAAPGFRARTLVVSAEQGEVTARLDPLVPAARPAPTRPATSAPASQPAAAPARPHPRRPTRDWPAPSGSDNRDPWAQ